MVIVSIADYERNNSPVVKIQDCTQIDFSNLYTNVILKLRYIGKPFLIWCISVEVSIQVVLSDIGRIFASASAALGTPLYRLLYTRLAANTENPFVLGFDIMLFLKLIF